MKQLIDQFNKKTMAPAPVKRLAYLKGYGDVVVSLNPDMTITLRKKGKRLAYTVHLLAVMHLALLQFMKDENQRRNEQYEKKKKLGIYKGLRKPKQLTVSLGMFPKQYLKAVNA